MPAFQSRIDQREQRARQVLAHSRWEEPPVSPLRYLVSREAVCGLALGVIFGAGVYALAEGLAGLGVMQ